MTQEHGAVQQWLARLGAATGLDGLQLDDNGCLALRYGEGLELMLELPEGSPVAHLYAPVLQLGGDEAGLLATFRRLLALNLFALETQGATFALDEMHQRIVLQYPLVVQATDAGLFERVLGNFIETAQRWQAQLASGAAEPGPPPFAEPPPLGAMMLRI